MAFLILGLFFVLFAMRLSRWLAIVQQKEYRFDRIWLFHHTQEGLSEVVRILPKFGDFSRTGMKRPKRTGRVMVAGFLTVAMSCFLFFSVITKNSSPGDFLKVLVGLYLLVPAMVMITLLPTAIVKFLITQIELSRAQKKIQQGIPIIVGITGSYGKTTTKQLLFQVLSHKFSVFMPPGSYNTQLSVAQSIRRKYVNQEIAILEYAAYTKGEIKSLAGWFQPQLAVVTGLTPQHLGLFGSLENIISAKSELVKAVGPQGAVFCNGADAGAVEICKVGGVKKPTLFGGKKSAITVKDVGLNERGQLYFTWSSQKIQTKLVGEHYLAAVQATIVVAKHLGLGSDEIIEGLKKLKNTESFIQTYSTASGALVIDDGKTANKRGFEAALDLLNTLKRNGESVLITSGIVDLGSQSSSIHTALALKAKGMVSKVLYTGIEGRQEFHAIFGNQLIFEKEAIESFLQTFDIDDVVLIEGKVPSWALPTQEDSKL